jgi:miniconductance mechanosensitive channel
MSSTSLNELITNFLSAVPEPLILSASLVLTGLIAWLAYLILKIWLVALLHKMLKSSNHEWDDTIIETGLLHKCARMLPPLIFYSAIDYMPGLGETSVLFLQNLSLSFLVLFASISIGATLDTLHQIYNKFPIAKDRPIKSFVQILKIILVLITSIILISLIINRSPVLLLSGLGALTALTLLIFKDTLLSLVASIQITSLGLVKVGDWIEMPSCNADGDVIDVQLHTVKVQNWDKTISTIPTHRMISESFKNWRGMSESGTRRIKRSIKLDLTSVRFLSNDEVKNFKDFALLGPYIKEKEQELANYNNKIGKTSNINLRRLTNLGTYRAYILNYLKNHPQISESSTLLVRQLAPDSKGIPLEIYAFTNTSEWLAYEDIQSNIFDHLLTIAEELKLKIYQEPSGNDFQKIKI